jgi:2-polyprenyl-3-methyl-5-hydroxy-6-metoxy-1,4-benzoquinol methylase
MNCIVCNSVKVADYLTYGEYNLLECSDCGLIFLEKFPATEALRKLYPEDYYQKNIGGLRFVHRLYLFLLAFFEKRKIKKLSAKGRVLDVGCGDGSFLGTLQDFKNLELFGVEVSISGFNEAAKRRGAKIYNTGLAECRFPDGFFDIVTLRHVIEHVTDPVSLLLEIKRILRDNGVLLIRVPNIDSVEARLGGKEWLHLDIPRHVCHYTPKSLPLLLQKTGFKDIMVNHFLLEYKHVILYSILAWLQCKNSLMRKLAMIFTPIAVVFSYILAVLKKSGTIEVIAKK